MKLTPPQLKAIWALARERGIDADAVRAMTPRQSVSALSIFEAGCLIDALQQGRPPNYAQRFSIPVAPPPVAPAAGARIPSRTDAGGPDVTSGFPRASSHDSHDSHPSHPPRRRLPPGSARLPTLDSDLLRSQLLDEVGKLWNKSLAEMERWMSTRHYSHGGPMNVVLTTADNVECIELLKAVRSRARAAIIRRQAATVAQSRDPTPPLFSPAHAGPPDRQWLISACEKEDICQGQ